MKVQLAFSKIYTFNEFINSPEIKDEWRGIYVWGFRLPEYKQRFLVYYVGRHYTSIVQRVKLHHDKHIPLDTHNIYKKEYLPHYFKYALYKKPANDLLFEEYKDKFAYLNADKNWKAINIPKRDLPKNEIVLLEPHIDYYIEHFHVCCIPVNEVSLKISLNLKSEKQLIADLERHVQYKIPHVLSTKKIEHNFPYFDIDTTNLGPDDFFSETYKAMTTK